uniref:Uncharacterized protein n=1 Tax=Parascaris equorum TaxID=6256 RepID=A0A914SD82_PAREQ
MELPYSSRESKGGENRIARVNSVFITSSNNLMFAVANCEQ